MAYRIKKWDEFQHYKERRPPWIKLYRTLLDDPNWYALDGETAKMLVMMWLIASDADGYLPASNVLAFRLRITEKQCNSLLDKVKDWLDSDVLARCLQDATPETETETETEKRESKPPAILIYPKFWDDCSEPWKAWGEWQAYRKPLGGVKNWTLFWQKQLDWIAAYTSNEAIQIINTSIRNGWRGLFEPKSALNQSQQTPKDFKVARIKVDKAFVWSQNVQDAIKKLDHGKDDISRTLKVLNDSYRDCGVNAKGQTVATEAYEYWKLGEELKRREQ